APSLAPLSPPTSTASPPPLQAARAAPSRHSRARSRRVGISAPDVGAGRCGRVRRCREGDQPGVCRQGSLARLPEPTGAGTLDSTSRVSPTLTLDFTLISLTTEVVGWDGLPAAAPEAGGRSLVSEGCRVTVPAMGTSPAAAAAQPSTAAPVA